MILHGDDLDIAMRYEGLYRHAFDDCMKQEDPWGEATQQNYDIFMETDLSNGKTSLYRIIHKLLFDNFRNNTSIKNKLMRIEGQINEIKNQEDSISIIDEVLALLIKNMKKKENKLYIKILKKFK